MAIWLSSLLHLIHVCTHMYVNSYIRGMGPRISADIRGIDPEYSSDDIPGQCPREELRTKTRTNHGYLPRILWQVGNDETCKLITANNQITKGCDQSMELAFRGRSNEPSSNNFHFLTKKPRGPRTWGRDAYTYGSCQHKEGGHMQSKGMEMLDGLYRVGGVS